MPEKWRDGKRFLLYPVNKVWKILCEKGYGRCNAHSVCLCAALACAGLVAYTGSVGILFLDSFSQGFSRRPFTMSRTSPALSLYI